MSEADWDVFNPGFDHGEVTVRKANIDGVFSADKLRLEDQHTDVRTANLPDNIGEEGFDWQSVDVGGADVRVANCRGGQLGSDSFNWSAVPGSADVVRSANLGSAIDESAFDAIDKAGADVRPANCPGQVGDRAFDGLVAKQQTPLTFMQRAWRLAAFPLALVPFSAITPSMAAAPKRLAPFLGASIAAVGLLGVRALLKRVLLVKQGTLCFVQYAENGTTHVLQAGVHLGASFGVSAKTFDVKENHMSFGTVSFVRVRPGYVGIGADNGKPVLLLPGQHLFHEATFELVEFADINENRISSGPLHLIRVPPATLGLATLNKKPIILDTGVHFLHSPGFEWQGTVSVNANYVSNGPISIIRVQPGYVGFATCSKRAVLLGVGLHFINDPSFEYVGNRALTDGNFLQNGAISLVRVAPSTLGLGSIQRKPVVLDAGLHLIFEPSLEYIGPASVNDDIIQVGPVSIIRVPPGMVALSTLNGSPTLLDVGVHFINDVALQMADPPFRRIDEPLISLGPMNIITVPRGKIVPVIVDGEGHFLLEGRHFISHPRISIKRAQCLTDEYVFAGTRHRIVVPNGKLGLALERGEPVVYEPGSVHLVHSTLFEYRGAADVTQQLVSHASLKIVTVKDGQVGITYNNGVLELLQTGRHTIEVATHVLAGFVSTGQQTLRISEVTGMSLDNVELTFDAAICVRVIDAQKAVVMLTCGRSDADIVGEIQANIQERAKLDLSTIIGKNRLNKKHEATTTAPLPKKAVADEDDYEHLSEPSASDIGGGFRTAIHDNFMIQFKQEMREECGVEVINMAIEDVKIVDSDLAKALASAAVANSALERQTIDAEIVQVRAGAESKVAQINAEGQAAAMRIMARAEADRIETISKTLEQACEPVQRQEVIRTSGGALTSASTVLLAQDMGGLATLLGGAQGAALAPAVAARR